MAAAGGVASTGEAEVFPEVSSLVHQETMEGGMEVSSHCSV